MNYQLIPDLRALATLLPFCISSANAHPQERVDLWLVGLLFIFLEAIVHAAYPAAGPWHCFAHVIRAPDTLARFGGDEFIIIATDLPNDQPAELLATRSLSRVCQALRKSVVIGSNALTVTGSVGVAIYPDDATDEVLLRRIADERMHQQKRQIPQSF